MKQPKYKIGDIVTYKSADRILMSTICLGILDKGISEGWIYTFESLSDDIPEEDIIDLIK